jgi:RNA polymerase sigma factor (sigma-70 family)
MATGPETLLQYIRRLVIAPEAECDASLLGRFISAKDEKAFTALVDRHGALVLQVCRRILGDVHDAEDAFQAVFLILARKAAAVHPPEALAAWLHGVAGRVALKARSARARQIREDRSQSALPADPHADPLAELSARELLTIIDEEVQRLPERYRLPLIICSLGGRSLEEAARQLGWTSGSVKGRLERGRARLHDRLVRRGLTLSAALAAVEASRATASAAALAALVVRTIPGALAFGAGQGIERGVSASAAAVAGLVVKAMALPRLTMALALLLTTAALGAGIALHVKSPEPASRTQDPSPRAHLAALQKPIQQPPEDAAKQLQALFMNYNRARTELYKPAEDKATPEEQDEILVEDKIVEKLVRLNADYVRRVLEVARKHPEERKVVGDALTWVVWNAGKAGNTPEEAKAVDSLIRDHLNDKNSEIDSLLQRMIYNETEPGERLLRAAAKKIEDSERKALARYCLAQNLKNRFESANLFKGLDAKNRRHLALFNGKDILDQKAAGDSAKLLKEAEDLYVGLAKDSCDMKVHGLTMKEFVEAELYDIRYLSIGKPAPEIDGEDIDGKRFKLSEYRGKVVVLDFWGHGFGHCRAMYPHERSLVKRLAGKPFALLGINCDTDREELKKTMKQEHITWRSWWIGRSTVGPIAKKWNVHMHGCPTIYVLDAQGVIRYKGVLVDAMGEAIDGLLKELEGGRRQSAWGWESSAIRWWASVWQTANRRKVPPSRSPD